VNVPSWASSSLLLLLGCADAAGRYEAFAARRGGGAGGAGAGAPSTSDTCSPPAPGSVEGPALLAIETDALPEAAVLFFGELSTPELDGRTAVMYRYRALDATDRRTELGDELSVGPYAIEPDGSFEAPTPEATLPGAANPILPGVPITSQLTLHGSICEVSSFYCGSVSGRVSSPVQGPARGQFGLTLLDTGTEVPARPRFGCSEDALAEALEE
jgi:hypothetical protein